MFFGCSFCSTTQEKHELCENTEINLFFISFNNLNEINIRLDT